MVKVMAPFTPFLTEHMYQNLKHFIVKETGDDLNDDSVHYLMLPEPRYPIVSYYLISYSVVLQYVVSYCLLLYYVLSYCVIFCNFDFYRIMFSRIILYYIMWH